MLHNNLNQLDVHSLADWDQLIVKKTNWSFTKNINNQV